MIETAVELVFAPLLTGLASLAARRWGSRVGGVVSAFPAIVGPVLLILALGHGAPFAARAANGTLLGLLALSGFALAYGRTARRRSWGPSLAAGRGAAALAAAAVGLVGGGVGAVGSLLVAICSLTIAGRMLPVGVGAAPWPRAPGTDSIALRMALTALLVTVLAVAAGHVGPLLGGMLAALPVLASVLAVFTHRD